MAKKAEKRQVQVDPSALSACVLRLMELPIPDLYDSWFFGAMVRLGSYMTERVEDAETRKELRPVWKSVVKRLDEMLAADHSLNDERPEVQAVLRNALGAMEST